jgi:hypothetical protein
MGDSSNPDLILPPDISPGPTPFPTITTGTTPAPLIADINELLASYGAIKNQENSDRVTLSVLVNETRETLRPPMFAWAAAGFPAIYILQEFVINPPPICSDGVTRNFVEYVAYLLGQDMGQLIATIQALCIGVTISYSFMGNALRIHVTKN